jgi:hypothetical protein
VSAQALLDRLDGVRQYGAGRWRARCPAHGSKGGTLSVHEKSDGRVLVHCFAGCAVEEVVGAVGLAINDLFPEERIGERIQGERLRVPAGDLLLVAAFEVLKVATIAAAHREGGPPFTDGEVAVLYTAAGRLGYFLEATRASR